MRSLKGWLPNDAHWKRYYTRDELQEQCRARKLPTNGYMFKLVERLEAYSKNDKSEKRRSSWKTVPPNPDDYKTSSEAAENAIFQVIRVMDKTGREGVYLDKHFTVLALKGAQHTVSFTRDIACSCQNHRQSTHCCVHIQYVLRYVLSCPEPFRWQGAFLSSELEIMYRNSRGVNTLLCAHRKDRNLFPICALCFKTSVRDGSGTCCLTCGSAMHNSCVYAAQRARKLERQDECWRCEDGAEWSLDKYSSKEKARRAGPAAPIVTPAAIDLREKTVQQSLEHPARYEDEQRSSSDQIADDEKCKNQLAISLPPKPPTLPLRPASPTLATALILPAPQGIEDAHLEPGEIHETTDTTAHFPPTAPPFPPPPPPPIPPPVSTMDWSNEESKSASCSSKDMNAPSHFTDSNRHSTVLRAPAPGADAGAEQTRGGSHSSSCSNAQVDGIVPQALEIGDESAAGRVVSGVTGEAYGVNGETSGVNEPQDVSSTPADETNPAPDLEPASPHTPVSLVSKTNIEERQAIKLVRDFKRLAKESDRIRKHTGQEIQDIKKKRRKEIKKVKLRSKRELKRLKKKMKRLEDEAKALYLCTLLRTIYNAPSSAPQFLPNSSPNSLAPLLLLLYPYSSSSAPTPPPPPLLLCPGSYSSAPGPPP
ncbi:hypothetical protein QBC45DRAFT_393251 [Copromyces sp. CBS 386.78]|nr:hypothetical protein QBC45DRAFT_393251 [Copromyces sp. CBS 386.78]